MTPGEFQRLGVEAFGREHGWQSWLARALNVDSRTVRRWVSGERAIPDWAANFLRLEHATVCLPEGLARGIEMLDELLDDAGVDVDDIPEWTGIRVDRVAYLVHEGAAVGVGLWDDKRGIIAPRLIIAPQTLDGIAESIRTAHAVRTEHHVDED